MSFEFFVARRLFVTQKGEKRISKPAVLIAQWGVAVGILVMILSVCIVVGFKHSVREKIVGFGQHIQVRNYEGTMYGESPVTARDSLLAALAALPGVHNVQKYVQKPGLIAVGDEFDGIMLKGVGADYDFSFFAEYLKEGEIPQFGDTAASGSVLLSKALADRMQIKILANDRNTTSGMTKPPIEWCDEYFHTLTITSIPFSRNGIAIFSIVSAGIFSNVSSGVTRSIT